MDILKNRFFQNSWLIDSHNFYLVLTYFFAVWSQINFASDIRLQWLFIIKKSLRGSKIQAWFYVKSFRNLFLMNNAYEFISNRPFRKKIFSLAVSTTNKFENKEYQSRAGARFTSGYFRRITTFPCVLWKVRDASGKIFLGRFRMNIWQFVQHLKWLHVVYCLFFCVIHHHQSSLKHLKSFKYNDFVVLQERKQFLELAG